ncbi:Eukaryotic elongation factor 2 kinase [Nymphon striatum]|nr:Eukaryotic elongation factor 2 kinase [Nymphon striatum]
MEVGAIDIPKNNRRHYYPKNVASSYEEDLILEPLSFSDMRTNTNTNTNVCDDDDDFSPNAFDTIANNNSNFFSVVMGMKRNIGMKRNQNALQHNAKGTAKDQVERSVKKLNVSSDDPMRLQWKQAIMKAKLIEDPWTNFHIDEYETETATRYRYNALRKSWVKDEVYVKREKKPFNHGAMRECFRLKKLSNFTQDNWKTAANYVVKQYMDIVDRKVYFDDVRLQMDAKLWGEEYNRHNPPKKVDIFQMSVLEFLNRPGKPLYHVEHYIEGNYIKYNSNSGYVVEDACRFTPQAFSHFTFERSGHQLIIVDIQGVGDLYTDPQIHTVKGDDYGDGNLGTKGMALFFHSHICNDICHGLGLSPFDLYQTEIFEPVKTKLDKNFHTMIRGTEEICMSPSKYEKSHWHEFLRHRSISTGSNLSCSPPDSLTHISSESPSEAMELSEMQIIEGEELLTPRSPDSGVGSLIASTRRHRCSSSDSGSMIQEAERVEFGLMLSKTSRPSCVDREVGQLKDTNERQNYSVLGQIHLDLAKYHEMCRFTAEDDVTYDKNAALFHLEQSSKCGILEAIVTLSKIYTQMAHDILVEVELPESKSNFNKGVELTLLAAQAGDRSSMLTMAKAFDTGLNLGTELLKSWDKAVCWYDKAVKMVDVDESGEYDGCIDDPTYQILARQAEMFLTAGNGLDKDPEKSGELFTAAADAAMAAMKGRLANKYYAQAEEAWAQMEE